jgi:hypothetical protein
MSLYMLSHDRACQDPEINFQIFSQSIFDIADTHPLVRVESLNNVMTSRPSFEACDADCPPMPLQFLNGYWSDDHSFAYES